MNLMVKSGATAEGTAPSDLYTDTMKVLGQEPWPSEVDPLEGFILHETEAVHMKAG
jgi:hypothetical protein